MKILRKKLDDSYGDILVHEVEGEKNTYSPATIKELLHAENTAIQHIYKDDRCINMILDKSIINAQLRVLPIKRSDSDFPFVITCWEITNHKK